MTTEITVQPQPLGMPAMSLTMAVQRRQTIIDFTKQVMVAGRDYGQVPGTSGKDTLFKPGAEKLSSLFGLWPDFEPIDAIEDWTGNDHDGEPFFSYRYRCTMRRIEDNRPTGSGVGSCNSWEKKYRFVYGKRRDNPQDIVNTIDKMAQKRALVAAVLIAVNASEFFTQDLEDYGDVIEGEIVTKKTSVPTKKAKSNGNGDAWTQFINQVKEAGISHYDNEVRHIVGAAKLLGITADSVGEDLAGNVQKAIDYGNLRGAGMAQAEAVKKVTGS